MPWAWLDFCIAYDVWLFESYKIYKTGRKSSDSLQA